MMQTERDDVNGLVAMTQAYHLTWGTVAKKLCLELSFLRLASESEQRVLLTIEGGMNGHDSVSL